MHVQTLSIIVFSTMLLILVYTIPNSNWSCRSGQIRLNLGGLYPQGPSNPSTGVTISALQLGTCNWIHGLDSIKKKNFSEEYQDGIIQEIVSHIGTENKFFVEFGFREGVGNVSQEIYNQSGLNTANLLYQGWNGVYFDALLENSEYNIIKAVLTADTIVEHFLQAGVPYDVDYVSIDVDSVDLWLLKAIIDRKNSPYKPRLISIEHNSNFAADMMISMEPTWYPYTWHSVFGASAGALNYIAELSGYTTIHLNTMDLFMVRNEVLESICSSPPTFAQLAKSKIPRRRNDLCIIEDAQRIIDVPALLNYPENLAYANLIAKQAVMRLASEFDVVMCTEEVYKSFKE